MKTEGEVINDSEIFQLETTRDHLRRKLDEIKENNRKKLRRHQLLHEIDALRRTLDAYEASEVILPEYL